VEFDAIELQTLQRVAPAVAVGFPTTSIDAAIRRRNEAEFGTTEERLAEAAVEQAKRDWQGRWLNSVLSRKDRWTAEQITNAYNGLLHLHDVLTEQSDESYWHGQLWPGVDAAEREATIARGSALFAPGTDAAKLLADTRRGMLRDVDEAMPILYQATQLVGPRPRARRDTFPPTSTQASEPGCGRG
jgi:hypothetical protein